MVNARKNKRIPTSAYAYCLFVLFPTKLRECFELNFCLLPMPPDGPGVHKRSADPRRTHSRCLPMLTNSLCNTILCVVGLSLLTGSVLSTSPLGFLASLPFPFGMTMNYFMVIYTYHSYTLLKEIKQINETKRNEMIDAGLRGHWHILPGGPMVS